jgi:hypothetical protein
VSNNPLNWIDPSGFTEEAPGGAWFSNFDTLFGLVPSAAIDMSQTLVLQLASAVAAMDFPNGNDAPNSSGCPTGTGTAPRPCAAPGQAGCMPLHQREPPTVRQAPPKTFGDTVGRILRLEEPPDEIGLYSLAYHIKQDIVSPTLRWLANEPTVYLDADHNVRTSSVHRDYSHEMAPVLGQAALILAPGANALAHSGSAAAREAGATVELFHGTTSAGARSILTEGLLPVSKNTAPFPAGSFFTHAGAEGQVAASHWAARSAGLHGGQPVLLRGTMSQELFNSLTSQGLIRTGPVPGLPFFPPQTVILPEGLGAASSGVQWTITPLTL